jgi:hypothetical protein
MSSYVVEPCCLAHLAHLSGHENIRTTESYLRAFQARDARKGVSVLDQLDRHEKGLV